MPKVSLQVPGLVVPYRNHPVVAAPFGFALPFNVAVVPVRFVAAFVVVDGGVTAVVKESTAPKEVEVEFLPRAQK